MQNLDRESIEFNVPTLVGDEIDYIRDAIQSRQLSGNGGFTQACQTWLESHLGNGGKALLTHSCTAALEMAAILANIGPGDEVIMPSYTFTSTANAFVLRGAVPVFIDIRPDTLNINEQLIEAAIASKTKALCVVHYAGVGAAMDQILEIASKHGLCVIEDAAQGLFAKFQNRSLGTFGQFSAFSFHETKNIMSGEGGALFINDRNAVERAEVIWEKGTNRAQFKRGAIAKYTWVDIGSSFLPSEITAAFLLRQLEAGDAITLRRRALWDRYFEAFAGAEACGALNRPSIPGTCQANGHIFFLLLRDQKRRDAIAAGLQRDGIHAIMHYVPLHSSPAGLRFGRVVGPMTFTNNLAGRLLRLPLHPQLTEKQQDRVITHVLTQIDQDKTYG